MNGIINVLKPPGMTSFDVVAWLRGVINVRKIGHLGTLDPGAAGVLPVCVGSATGVSPYVSEFRKRYRVEAVAGLLTDTLDTFGSVIEQGDDVLPKQTRFEEALGGFLGKTYQIPPMYSAVRVGGRRLYDIARHGGAVERAPRQIEIFSYRIVSYGKAAVIFDVECSQGTYVRSLVYDIGERLGIRLCMSFLLRTVSAGLSLEDALSPEKIETLFCDGGLCDALLPIDTLLTGYRAVRLLNPDAQRRYLNGAAQPPESFDVGYHERAQSEDRESVSPEDFESVPPEDRSAVRVYGESGFIGMGLLFGNGNTDGPWLRAKKTFIGAV